MEVKKGYKQTEVGLVPEDWVVKSFFTMCLAILDCHHSTPVWTKSGVLVIRNQNIRDGKLDFTTPSFTDEQHYLERTKRAVPSFGDLVITREAPIGLVCMIPKGLKCCLGQRMVLLRIDHNSTDPRYALYALLSNTIQRSIFVAAGTGSTVSNLRIPALKELQVVAPSKAEQVAIAEALSDVDALIESLEKLIAKKRLIKQGVMQELLTGKKRLPGFSGEWEVKRLGDIGVTYGGLTNKVKSDFGVGSSSYVTFMNIMSNVVIDCNTFEKLRIQAGESQNRIMKGDLFFNGSSETPEEVGMCSALIQDVQDVYLNSFCFGFRFRNEAEANGLFFAYYFRSNQGRELIKSLSQGATRYNLSKTALLRVLFPIPSFEEQTAIAILLNDIDAEIAELERKLEKARKIKQGMMHNLLTGKIRLV